jgi:competence protein ComEA
MKSLVAVIVSLVVFVGCLGAFAEEAQSGKVNVNTATAQELTLLPRVGGSIAKRIIEFRTQHGQFQKAEDLMLVKGIGKKMYEQLKPYIVLAGPTTLNTDVRVPRKSK